MWWAIVRKELREIAPIGLLAVAVHLVFVSGLMGIKLVTNLPFRGFFLNVPQGTQGIPFVHQDFAWGFTIVTIVFAIVLAFRQAAWEDIKGTYLFLFHRPMARTHIFLAKILTGIGFYVVCSFVPIVVYGWWAATPGNHPGPFEWSMTWGSIRILFTIVLLYLGILVTYILPARWLGTRILPLVAVGCLAMAIAPTPLLWPLSLSIIIILASLLITTICHIATNRDYA